MKNGVNFAIRNQNNDGGWGRGGGPDETEAVSSIEETGVVLESLATVVGIIGATETTESVKKGLQRLKKMVENRDNDGASPIGLYFAKLWYFESLYPTVFGLAAVAAVENSAGFGAKKSP